MKEITGGQGFTIAYDPVGGAFIGDLVAAAQPYGLIVNYGNLRTEPINIPVLPMLAKRLFFKFHSLYDTMRLPEKRAACFAFVHDEVASGALKANHRPDLPPGADRGRASLHGNQRAARQDRRHHLSTRRHSLRRVGAGGIHASAESTTRQAADHDGAFRPGYHGAWSRTPIRCSAAPLQRWFTKRRSFAISKFRRQSPVVLKRR